MTKLYVIGIGYRPLDKKAREIILNSEVILANNRLYEVFRGYDEFKTVKDRIKVINNVDETINFIKSHIEDTPPNPPLDKGGYGGVVLLASGDPMFFGIGRRAVNEFGKDTVEIFPDLSSIQVAFSRIKEPWGDVFFVSLHGGPDPAKRRRLEYEIEDIPALLLRHNEVAILTDKENNPVEIAKTLLKSEISDLESQILRMYVCERLGYSDEKIIDGAPQDIAKMFFSDPNVVIILKNRNALCVMSNEYKEKEIKLETCHASRITRHDFGFGLKEDEIQHNRGLITKDEVRAVAIHKLRLPQKGIFWDIGAGSGSISVEVARLCPELKVFAIEKDEKQIENINENKKRFNVVNIEVIKGEAPDTLEGLPAPDRALIGGSGGRLSDIVSFIDKKIDSGIIAINATTIETLNKAMQCLENAGFRVEVCEVSISKSKVINQKKHMSALNPVFIVTGEKS